MRTLILIALICLNVAGCSSSDPIEPIYIAPQAYRSLGCDEIAGEARRVARAARAVAGISPDSADGSAKVIVWPSLASANPNDSARSALGRLKGEFNALVLAANKGNCELEFQQGGA